MSLSLVNFSSISYENFHTIIAFKFWTCFAIVCDENNYETANLITVAALINENPQLEKLDIKFETRNLTNMGTFFVALVKSRLQSIIIQLEYNGSLPEGYATKVGSTLDTLPLNNSVRRLEIRHGTGDLCSFCVKYFRNIRCLKVLLSNADVDVIFKYLVGTYVFQLCYITTSMFQNFGAFVIVAIASNKKIKGASFHRPQTMNFCLLLLNFSYWL